MQNKKEEGKKAYLEGLALPLHEKSSSSRDGAPALAVVLWRWRLEVRRWR
jgi:hypothetical protein